MENTSFDEWRPWMGCGGIDMKRSLSLLSMFLIVVGHVFAQGPTGTPPPVVVSQVTVSNDTKRLVFPTPSEFAQSNDILMTNGSAFNLTNFPSYLLTNTLINGRLGNVSNRIAVTTLSLQDVTSADGTNVINGTLQSSEISGYVIVTNFLIATQVPGLPQANWRGLATSSNGQIMVATASGNYVYVTTNSGALWTAQTGLGIYDWNPPAMSKDGSIIYLSGGDTPLYRSMNYGSTWANIDGSAYPRSPVSCSDDGQVMAFAYPSSMNWSTNAGTTKHFENIVGGNPHVSGDGKTLTKVIFTGPQTWTMYVAYNDLGADYPVWTLVDSRVNVGYISQAMSYDGSIMYWTYSGTGGNNWPAYLSTNRGVSFVEILPASTWGDIDCTPDGSKIQVMSIRNGNGYPGQVLLSTDFGSTWTSNGIAIDEVGTVYTPYWYYWTGFMQHDGMKGYAATAGDANGVYYAITLGTEMTQSVSIVSDVHITGSMTVDGGIYGSALSLTNFGTILPASSNVYDIGSSNMPFRHGYFGSNSLYLAQYRLGVSSNGSLTYNDYPVVSTGGTSIAVDTNMQAQMNATTQRVYALEQMTDTWNTVTSKLATNGSASGLTNFPIVATASNALLLNGLTSEEVMQVGATYYFTTNVISYGAVTGRQASLTVPTVTQSSIYTGPVTAGQYFASYLIPSNQMPTVLEIGTYIFQFYGGHIDQAAKNPTIMGDLYVKDAVTGTTIQEFESLPVVIPYGTNEPFKIQITTTNAYPKDGYAFLLRTKLVDTDGYTGDYQSQFGPRGYAGFTLSRVVGVYVTYAEWDAVIPYRVGWNTNNTYSAGTTQDFRNAVLLGGTVTISNLTVTEGNVVQTNQATYTTTVAKASTAWQNPSSATNWTWTSDGTNITLTGYTGPTNGVVIPDMLDNLPVTSFGSIFSFSAITSIKVGVNVTSIDPGAFTTCFNLTNVSLPSVTSVGATAFMNCTYLTRVYFGSSMAPAESALVFDNCPATNYVTNPQATGWRSTWNTRPVVRLNTYANESYVGPSAGTNLPVYVTLTNLASRINSATNGLWIQTTNLVTGTSNSLVSTINSATNGLWVSTTNYVAGIIAGSGKLWMTDNGATSILYHVTSGGRTNKIGEYFSTP